MKKAFLRLATKALTVFLCAVMLMTTFSLPISALTGEDIQLSVDASSDKSGIAQIGASLNSEDDVISVSNSTSEAGSKPVQTVTNSFAYIKEDAPKYNNRYIIMHEATGNLMSYKAYEPENPATSIVYNQNGNGDNMYYFATDAEGNIDRNTLYIDHSDRDEALWLLRQDFKYEYGTGDENDKQTIENNDVLSHWSDVNADPPVPMKPFLTDNAIRYHHAYFFKGNGPTWNENGTIADTKNGAYWYSVVGQDADEAGNQERFLRLYLDHASNYGTSDVNTQIEPQEDGTFIVFRRITSTTPTTYNMLTCGSDGIWNTVAVEDLNGDTPLTTRDNYKLSFYRYVSVMEKKQVNFKGYQTYDVLADTSKEQVIESIANNVTVMNVTNKNMTIPCSGDSGKVGYYWLEFTSDFDSSAQRSQSTYNVHINYRNDDGSDTLVGAVIVNVHDELLIKGTGEITTLSGTTPQNTTEGYIVQNIVDNENTNCRFTVSVKTTQGVQTKTVPVTIGMLTDNNGNAVSTANNGTFEDLTLTYLGDVITNQFTLTVDDSDEALNYPVYPEKGSVNVTKTGNAVGKFNETGVANINLSTTGIPQNKGVDMIVVMDLSGSMSYGVTNTNRVDDETSRIFALQESLKAMITTLKASDVDYRIAMSDFGDIDSFEFDGAVVDKTNPAKFFFDGDLDGQWDQKADWKFGARREYYNHLNYVHSTYARDVGATDTTEAVDNDNRAMPYNVHEKKYEKALPNFTGKIIPNIYTGSHTVNADAFVDVDTFDDAAMTALLEDVALHQKNSLGTNYDVGLEYAYQLGHAIQERNIANGEDRDIICLFMSDGAAMQYNYFSGRATNQSWADWLNGEIEYSAFQHNAPSQASDSSELVLLMNDLLNKLVNGTLENPKYGVKANLPDETGNVNFNDGARLLPAREDAEIIDDNTGETTPEGTTVPPTTSTVLRFDFSQVDISGAETFYAAMEALGVNLHWDLLDRIAKANGLKNYTCSADVEDELLALAKADMLNYPVDEAQYYPQYTGDSEDFFTAMSELGIICNWELFVQIATDNVADGRLDDVYGELTTLADGMSWGTLSPYYYFYNEEGKNWYAEAIKGSRSELYPVVNKHAFSNNTDAAFEYYGDVRNNFSTGTGMELDGKDYISGFRGLDIPIYTVGLSLCTEGYLTEQTAKDVLSNISSGPNYAFTANNKDELIDVFNTISTSSSVAATGAYFVDKMGPEFDLYTRRTVTNGSGDTVTINVEPKIRVLEYNLDANHERTGAPVVYETVTISEDALGNLIVTSDKIYNTEEDSNGNLIQVYPNILKDGVIEAKYFYYNTNKTETKGIDLTGDGKADWQLEAETFFWIIGPIGKTEMVLDYQVYLTGSMEGERDLGVYETNTSAQLNYVNYLGNNCSKDTVSPAFPWPNPFTGYAFYLVDENGNPLNANGDVSTFIDSFKITSPEYIEMLLNGEPNVVMPDYVMPESVGFLYELYDAEAQYKVVMNSDDSGYWNITKSESLSNTTYVTNYGGSPTNKNSSELTANVAYDRTVVWFALKIKNIANPDTVVIDYGLPVNVDVLANDALVSAGYKLEYVDNASVFDEELSANNATLDDYLSRVPVTDTALISASEADGEFGKATINENIINYALNADNGMHMSEEEVFAYGAYYGGTGAEKTGKGYYYSTLTVIPATSIYYEDNFVTYNVYDHNTGVKITDDNPHYSDLAWSVEGVETEATQAQDRPGEYVLPDLDAGNIYGYDGAYSSCSTYSLDSAHKVNVGKHTFADGTSANTRATAAFSFTGTGFDIVSLTSNTTGTVIVQVTGKGNAAGTNKFFMVDTYYGYKYDTEINEWVVDTDADNALYQIPVMKVEDLPYGTYDVSLSIAYAELFDHQQYDDAQNFDFYLDAIRIYDPANDGENSDVIKDAYIADFEGWPLYEELRNLILKTGSFGTSEDNAVVNGAVFIDNTAREEGTLPSIEDYTNFGPNNEVYLAAGQAVAFKLEGDNIRSAHLAMKSVNNCDVSVKVFDASVNNELADEMVITTATDLYYDFTILDGKTVVIYNCSSDANSILSVTNIKMTFDSKPEKSVTVSDYIKMSSDVVELALSSLEPMPEEVTTAPTEPTEIPTTATEAPTSTEPITGDSSENVTDEPLTEAPTNAPTNAPTAAPTDAPTDAPTNAPTAAPVTSAPATTEPTQPTTSVIEDVLLGDANLDSKLNIKDATAIQKHVAELITLDAKALKAADYNQDEQVNIKDATGIQKKIAGII